MVSARFRMTKKMNARTHGKGYYQFLGIYRLWRVLSLKVVVFDGGGILCMVLFSGWKTF